MYKSKFTLIELLVVIGIIGILMAILLPAISGAIKEAKKTQVQSQVKQIAFSVQAFHNEYQHYPTPAWPVTPQSDWSLTLTEFREVLADTEGDNPQNPRELKMGVFTHPQEKEFTIFVDGDYNNIMNSNRPGAIGVRTEFSGEVINNYD